MTHNYEYKYLKYKAKYNELKKNIQIGADNAEVNNDIDIDKNIKNIFNEFANGFLIPLYLETKCCYNDFMTISSKNKYQQEYIEVVRKELDGFIIGLMIKLKNNIENSNGINMDDNDILKQNAKIIKDTNLENLEKKLKNIIIPLIDYIVSAYARDLNNVDWATHFRIPHYKIKYTNDLNRTNKNCLKIDDDKEKCCDLDTNASNCIDYIVKTKIIRASYLLNELKEVLNKALPNTHQIEKSDISKTIDKINEFIDNHFKKSKKFEEGNKDFKPKPNIFNRLINRKSKYGEMEFIPIVNKK